MQMETSRHRSQMELLSGSTANQLLYSRLPEPVASLTTKYGRSPDYPKAHCSMQTETRCHRSQMELLSGSTANQLVYSQLPEPVASLTTKDGRSPDCQTAHW